MLAPGGFDLGSRGVRAAAYNEGLAEAAGEIVAFAHQDVYLPPGWSRGLQAALYRLNQVDPSWGAVGPFGVTQTGETKGFVYASGLRRFVGRPLPDVAEVSSLDEILVMLRRNSGLRFDENLPGFHLYGTDLRLQAAAKGLRSYVIPCFAFHNSRGIARLPWSFWRAYLYLRRKWRDRLPVRTPCTTITRFCFPMFRHLIQHSVGQVRGRIKPGTRVADPAAFYREHLKPALERTSTPPIRELVES